MLVIVPTDEMRSLSATPEPDALVFNINVEPPATYGPIDAAPASVTDISSTPLWLVLSIPKVPLRFNVLDDELVVFIITAPLDVMRSLSLVPFVSNARPP